VEILQFPSPRKSLSGATNLRGIALSLIQIGWLQRAGLMPSDTGRDGRDPDHRPAVPEHTGFRWVAASF